MVSYEEANRYTLIGSRGTDNNRKKIGIFGGRDKGLAGFMSRINAPLSGFF